MEDDLELEPSWKSCQEGTRADFIADLIIKDPENKKHLVLTAVHKTFLTLEATIKEDTVAITVLDGFLTSGKSGFHVVNAGFILEHAIPSSGHLRDGIEVCAGIGALGEGLRANGIQIQVTNDIRDKFTMLMQHQGFQSTVTGDVGSHAVLFEIHSKHPTPAMMGAGFPCQPWSQMGDQRKSLDARAGTLKSVLRAAYLLRCHSVLLECVVGARQDKKVLKQLRQWCQVTRFNAREITLDLNQIWCTNRKRWWCLLTFPGSAPPTLEPFPVFPDLIRVGDILPCFPVWPEDQQHQLEVGLYEYRKFEECGGINQNLINLEGQLKTSLHGWGNQLDPCPCGCRQFAMSLTRLQKRGMHGALIPLGGVLTSGDLQVPRMRHIHPWELSLLQGLAPNRPWMPHLKLALSGLGQMASPFQSGWIVAQLHFANSDRSCGLEIMTPERILWQMMESVFHDREAMFPGISQTPRVQKTTDMIQKVLMAASDTRIVPRQLPDAESIASTLQDSFDHLDNIETPRDSKIEPKQDGIKDGLKPQSLSAVLTQFCAHKSPCKEAFPVPEIPPLREDPASEEDWKQFELTEPKETVLSPKAISSWQSTGGIPGFQVGSPKTPKPSVSLTATWPVESQPTLLPGAKVLSLRHEDSKNGSTGEAFTNPDPSKGATGSHIRASEAGKMIVQKGFDHSSGVSSEGASDSHIRASEAGNTTVQKGLDHSLGVASEGASDLQIRASEAGNIDVQKGLTNSFGVVAEGAPDSHIRASEAGNMFVQKGSTFEVRPPSKGAPAPHIGAFEAGSMTTDVGGIAGKQASETAAFANIRTPKAIDPIGTNPFRGNSCRTVEGQPKVATPMPCHAIDTTPSAPAAAGDLCPPDTAVDSRELMDSHHGCTSEALTSGCTALPVIDCETPHGELDKNQTTSHRMGRKDPLMHDDKKDKRNSIQQPGTGTPGPENIDKQPRPRTSEPEKIHNQPASRTPEPDKIEAEEPRELHPPMSVQAMPAAAFVPAGPSPHPDDESVDRPEATRNSTPDLHQDAPAMHLCTLRIVYPGSKWPIIVKAPMGITAHQLIQAERSMGTIGHFAIACNNLGHALPLLAQIEPFQQVHFHERAPSSPCPIESKDARGFQSPTQDVYSRLHLLFEQHSHVAMDEMNFYLQQFAPVAGTHVEPVIGIPPKTGYCQALRVISNWIGYNLTNSYARQQPIATACLICQHWIPFLFRTLDGKTTIQTTLDGGEIIRDIRSAGSDDMEHGDLEQSWPAWLSQEIMIQTREIEHIFAGDCGFQAAVWTCNHSCSEIPCAAVTATQASAWRDQFQNHLLQQGGAWTYIRPGDLLLGGTKSGDNLEAQLAELLGTHGVPKPLASERANVVLAKLGRQGIIASMRAPNPWRDLKAKANAQIPKVQLVHPTELSEAIKTRAESGVPIGHKKKKTFKATNPPVRLRPEDVEIPPGVFRQADGEPVQQLSIQQIGPDAKGVIVTDSQTAAPFLQMKQPVSKQGLALLVLDHAADPILCIGEVMRFPGRCVTTAEPIITAARLIQIGAIPVSRNEPTHKLKVEETPNQVLRLLAFRDCWEGEWTQFTKNPVKSILHHLPDLQKQEAKENPILDLWDRQFVNLKLEKASPTYAQLFIVTIRVALTDIRPMLNLSGRNGIFLEPRTDDGRKPDPAYRVIWLPNKDKESLQAHVQTATAWSCLARTGTRFGLRTTEDHAETLHNQFKPNTPWIESTALMSYTVGPFPPGSTRAAILKICRAWDWNAKPVQPKARSADGKGVLWQLLAATAPDSEVYQLDHGDVLVTLDPPKKQQGPPQPKDLQASAKTLAALSTKATVSNPDEDPWAHYDPWTTPPKAAKTNARPSATKMDLEALEQRLDQKLLSHQTRTDGDTTMTVEDERINHLELRMQRLENNVQQHHQAYLTQHNEVQHQLQQVQTQVAEQGATFNHLLDQRFTQQLTEIERIMAKRPKTNE